jgi:two-component system, NarL family, nitrate/nitrite response regulator NarL
LPDSLGLWLDAPFTDFWPAGSLGVSERDWPLFNVGRTEYTQKDMLGTKLNGHSDPKASASTGIRILLVESHELILGGLRALLQIQAGMTVVGEARNSAEALDGLSKNPDIILLELDLGADSGIDVMESVFKSHPNARILIVTGSQNHEQHVQAVCVGAMGIVLKQQSPDLLVKAIRKVHLGEVWMNRTMMAEAMAQIQDRPARKKDPEAIMIESLTTRERAVISLIGEGLRNKDIGSRLFISEKTVRHYLTSIFSKLAVADRLELMIFAYQHGLARLPERRTAASN